MSNRISMLRLVLREMQRAKVNTAFCLFTVAIAASMLVAMLGVSQASVDATRVMMKNMGFNLLITPAGTDPARYQILEFPAEDMPEEYVTRLSMESTLPAEHFVGKYQKRIDLGGETVVLTGVMAEKTRIGQQKKPMPTAYEVGRGEVYLASAIAKGLGKAEGDTLELEGREFKVAKILPTIGAMPEDIRIYAELHDVQELVGRPGRINAIDALSCHCNVPVADLLQYLEQRIHEVLPDVEVTAYNAILLARHQQRTMMHLLGLITLSIVMSVSAAAIWGLTYQNVYSRRYEIGVLRALGVPGWRIAELFLLKIALYGVTGAALGCFVGRYAADMLNITERPIVLPESTWTMVILLTPLVAALFGLPSIVSRLVQEPVDVLGDRGA